MQDRFARKIAASAFSFWIALASAVVATAADRIQDPKAWCAEVTGKLAAGDVEAISRMLDEGSRGAMPAPEVRAKFELVLAKVREAKTINATAFLAEKNYESVLRSEWFMIVLDRAPYYVRCNLINYDGSWQFTNLDLRPSPVAVGL